MVAGRLRAASHLLRGRRTVGGRFSVSCRDDGRGDDWKTQGGGTGSGSIENALDEPSKERAQLYHGRWTTGDVGNAGIRGLDCVSG